MVPYIQVLPFKIDVNYQIQMNFHNLLILLIIL
jgi:hypothetical protein